MMRQKICAFVASGISALVSLVLFVIRGALVLSEYTETGASQLIFYSPLTSFAILFVFLSVFFFVVAILLCFKYRILLNNKKITIICSAFVIVAVCVATVSTVFSVVHTENRSYSQLFDSDEPGAEIPSEDKVLFPFFEEIDGYYFLDVTETPQAKYVSVQNSGACDSGPIQYRVELFEANSKYLVNQYIFQKPEPKATTEKGKILVEGVEKSIEGIDCIVYSHGNYLQIRIMDTYSCYSIIFDNLYDVSGSTVSDFEKLAIDMYSMVNSLE